jgi:hypothetical protein
MVDSSGPAIEVFTTSQVREVLEHKLDVRISERGLRKKARALNACRVLGNAFFFTQKDVDQLIGGLAPCRSMSTDAKIVHSGKSRVRSPESELDKARGRLANKPHKKKRRGSNVRAERTERRRCGHHG